MSQPQTQPPAPRSRTRPEWDLSGSMALLGGAAPRVDLEAVPEAARHTWYGSLLPSPVKKSPAPAQPRREAPAAPAARVNGGGSPAPKASKEAASARPPAPPAPPPRLPTTVGASLQLTAPGAVAPAPLPAKRPRAAPPPLLADEEDDDDAPAAGAGPARRDDSPELDNACVKCKRTDNPSQMVVCDGWRCPAGLHLSCGKLAEVPEGAWFCPDCAKAREGGVAPSVLAPLPLRALRGMFQSFFGVETHSSNSAWLRKRLERGLKGVAGAGTADGKPHRGRVATLGLVPAQPGADRKRKKAAAKAVAPPNRRRRVSDDEFKPDPAENYAAQAASRRRAPTADDDVELDELAADAFLVASPAGGSSVSEPEEDDLKDEKEEEAGADEDDAEDEEEEQQAEPVRRGGGAGARRALHTVPHIAKHASFDFPDPEQDAEDQELGPRLRLPVPGGATRVAPSPLRPPPPPAARGKGKGKGKGGRK